MIKRYNKSLTQAGFSRLSLSDAAVKNAVANHFAQNDATARKMYTFSKFLHASDTVNE